MVSKRTLQAVACFIAGEERDQITEITEHFRYRSGAELQMFFERADLDFTFDGSTRYYWVLDRLAEVNDGVASDPALPADGLRRVIEQTVHRDEIGSDEWQGAVDRMNKELARDGLAVVYSEQEDHVRKLGQFRSELRQAVDALGGFIDSLLKLALHLRHLSHVAFSS